MKITISENIINFLTEKAAAPETQLNRLVEGLPEKPAVIQAQLDKLKALIDSNLAGNADLIKNPEKIKDFISLALDKFVLELIVLAKAYLLDAEGKLKKEIAKAIAHLIEQEKKSATDIVNTLIKAYVNICIQQQIHAISNDKDTKNKELYNATASSYLNKAVRDFLNSNRTKYCFIKNREIELMDNLNFYYDRLKAQLDIRSKEIIDAFISKFDAKLKIYLTAAKNKKTTHAKLDKKLTDLLNYYKEYGNSLYKILSTYHKALPKHSANTANFDEMLNNEIVLYDHKQQIKELSEQNYKLKNKALKLNQVHKELAVSNPNFKPSASAYHQFLKENIIQNRRALLHSVKQECDQQRILRKELDGQKINLAEQQKIIIANDTKIKELKNNYQSLNDFTDKLVSTEIWLTICKKLDKKINSLKLAKYSPLLDKKEIQTKIDALVALKDNLFENRYSNKYISTIIAEWKYTTVATKQEKSPHYLALEVKRKFTFFSINTTDKAEPTKDNMKKKTESIDIIDDIESRYRHCII